MRNRTQFIKKALALVLSFVMMLSPCANAIAVTLHDHAHEEIRPLGENSSNEPEDDGKWHGTTADLVSSNYELSDAEKAILACKALIGESYSVEIPADNSNGNVTIDAENQTVTALPYELDGFVWVPTKAYLKYSNLDGTPGTDIEVELVPVGQAYVGAFQKPANAYHVEVTYSLYIEVDADLQEFLLNTPFDLVDGYDKMSAAANLSVAVNYINGRMSDLRMLYEGVHYTFEHDGEVLYSYSFGLEQNSPIKIAIGNLIADYEKSENNNRLTISKDFAEYMASSNKVAFMLEHGQEVKDHLAWFYEQINSIDQSSAELLSLAQEIEHLATGTGEGTVADAKDMMDEVMEEKIPGLVDDLFTENWPKLENALEEVFREGLKPTNQYYDQLKDVIPADFKGLQEEIADAYAENWPKLENALEEVFREGLKPTNEYYDQLKDLIPSDFAGLQAKIDEAYAEGWLELEDLIEDVADNGLDPQNENHNKIKDLLPNDFKGLIPTINEEVDKAKVEYATYIEEGYIELDSLKNKGLFTTPNIYQAIAQKRLDVAAKAEELREEARNNPLNQRFPTLLEIALEDINTFVTTVNGALDEMQNAVNSAADKLAEIKEDAKTKLRETIEEEVAKEVSEIKEDAKTKLRETIEKEANEKVLELKEDAKTKLRETIEEEVRKEALELVAEKKAELDDLAQTAQSKASQIRGLVSGSAESTPLDQITSMVRKEHNKVWSFLGKDYVKNTVTAEEFSVLDKAVKEGIDPLSGKLLVQEYPDIEIKEKLLAHETVITAYVAQNVVTVEVKAEVVPMGSVDSADLVPLEVKTTTLALDADTDAQSILDAIEACGVENDALAQWDDFYNVGSACYNRTISVQDKDGADLGELGSLTKDIRYVVTYTPKTYTITETYYSAGSNTTEVPYGYNWCLPRPLDPAKSYDYKINGIAQREGTIFRVTENIEVSRTEGKALLAKSLAELVAMSKTPGSDLSDKEKDVLLSQALLVDTVYFRTPDTDDRLAEVTFDGTQYKLQARAMDAGIVGMEASWVPVAAVVQLLDGPGSEISLSRVGSTQDYEGAFQCTQAFTSALVTYRLVIDGFDSQTLSDLMNLANVLQQETADQKEALDRLCRENNFYNNLANLNSSILGSVGSVVTGMSDAAKEALNIMKNQCINDETGSSYLYEYLTSYQDKGENGGLAYYYKGDNAEKIKAQIDLVNRHLPIVWNDQSVRDYIAEMSTLQSQFNKVEMIIAQLAAVQLKSVNSLVDTNGSFTKNLLEALQQSGTVNEHNGEYRTVELETSLSAVAPGQTSWGVKLRVLNKNGAEVATYVTENFRAQGTPVTASEFRQVYNELIALVPGAQYYMVTESLPTQDVILGSDPVIYTSDLTPKTYTVKIDGEADQTIYAFDAYTITLPGTGDPGLKYVYHIASNKVEVASGSLENFSLGTTMEAINALFGDDRELIITRDTIDINKESLLKFIEKFNKTFVSAGLLSGNNLEIALIPMQDEQGNLSVVLRIAKGNANISLEDLSNELLSLVKDLSYLGLNGSPLFGLDAEGELKLYLQTLINLLTNSGLGLETITTLFDDNGDINEMQLPGYSPVGATGDDIVVIGDKIINDANLLGGKLMESTLQFGVSSGNATSVPFFVTLQDFDKRADVFRQLKKAAAQIRPYLDLSLKNGALNTVVNAPDNAYAYLLTALMIVGEVDFDTLQTYQMDQVMDYFVSLIDPAFAAEDITATTFINTLKKTGFYDAIDKFDIEAHKSLMQTVYNLTDHTYDSLTLTGSSVGGLYEGVLNYGSLDAIINKKPALAAFKAMIAEIDSGLDLPITFNLKNRDQKYEALILDIRADGILSKYYLSRNAASDIARAKDQAVVILLSDVNSSITFNHDVILNLNGYTIYGDLTAKGAVTIVDSTLDTVNCGGVVGNLLASGGTFNISAGNYQDDIRNFLETGYALENNVVTNGFFRLEKSGNELNLYLGSDSLAADKSTVKVMAVDLIAKLLMNYYACSELVVDGNRIYGVNLINVTESLDTLSVLLEKIVGCISFSGSSAFVTQLLSDVTDFGGLADAIENGTPLVSYTLEHSAFNPHFTYEGSGQDGYFSFNVTSADNKLSTKLNVFVSDDVLDGYKKLACDILNELDRITSFEELKLDVQNVTYGNGGLDIDATAMADVIFDLSVDGNYPIILAAILAENETGAQRQKWIDAILDYQNSSGSAKLKEMLDAATAADLMAALEKTGSMKFSAILSDLGVTALDAQKLESKYTIVRKVVGKALDYLNKTGPSKTLGSLAVSGQYATYCYRLEKSSDAYAQVTLKLFAEEKAIVVKDQNGNVILSTDDLAAALVAATDGATIYINGPVKLAEDLTLPAVEITIAKADQINFNGKYFWFDNGNTVLTVDRDLSAFVKSDADIFCSEIEHTTQDGIHKFHLQGDGHEWIDIPAVDPDCVHDGHTAGVQCKWCEKYKEGYKPTVIPALGHTPGTPVIENKVTETCTTDGSYDEVTYCTECGLESGRKHVIVPALGHDFEETPDANGDRHCTRCDAIKIVVDPFEEDHINSELKETGFDTAEKIETALRDVATQSVWVGEDMSAFYEVEMYVKDPDQNNNWVIADKNHYPEDGKIQVAIPVPVQDPTKFDFYVLHMFATADFGKTVGDVEIFTKDSGLEIVDGNLVFTVTGLSPIYVTWTCKTHDYESSVTGPTCTEDGFTTHTCKECGHSYTSDPVPATGHTETTIDAIPATCKDYGWTAGVKCSVCQEVLVAPTRVDKLPHTETTIDAIPATCQDYGWTAGVKCSVCQEVLVAPTRVDKLPHTETTIDAIPATCQDYGWTAGVKCSVCQEVLVTPTRVDKLPHTETTIDAIPATCQDYGWTAGVKCSVCQEVLVAPTRVDKKPHTEVPIPGVPATETTTGWTDGVECSVCHEVLVERTELKLLPKIHVPTVNVVTPDGLIRGAKVDATNKYIFLDADPTGFRASDFGLVYFEIDNETASSITLASSDGSVIRSGGDLICNGDKVTVWAENADHAEVSVTYTIIIMGDANCDGKVNSRDTLLMRLAYVGDSTIEGVAALAADTNFDGKLNSRDTLICRLKYVYWSDNAYTSQTK